MDLLMTVGIVLLILWLLGLVTSYTLGGFIHILLILAGLVVTWRFVQTRGNHEARSMPSPAETAPPVDHSI
jgi:hypothetical protein